MVFSKNRTFSKTRFFDKLSQKDRFLDQTNEVLKKSEKSKCPKGVSPCFLSKNRMFSYWYFLGKTSRKIFF